MYKLSLFILVVLIIIAALTVIWFFHQKRQLEKAREQRRVMFMQEVLRELAEKKSTRNTNTNENPPNS